jgi:hypothetical protein
MLYFMGSPFILAMGEPVSPLAVGPRLFDAGH